MKRKYKLITKPRIYKKFTDVDREKSEKELQRLIFHKEGGEKIG